MNSLDILWAPLQFDFMQQALLISAVMAVPTALLSCLLVLQGWTLMGDAVSHAVLPGVVLAYLVGVPLEIGAVIAGLICTMGTGYIQNNSRLKRDTVMGVVFSGMFGLGIVLYTAAQSDVHLDKILFGDMLGTSGRDLLETGVLALLVVGAVSLKWRDLLLHAFDPIHARTVGLSVRLLHYGLLLLISLTIVGALKAVGIILVVALLIVPGAIAVLLVRRFKPMLFVSVIVSVLACLTGTYLSFFLDSAPAPTIVVVHAIFFVMAFAWEEWRTSRRRMQVTA